MTPSFIHAQGKILIDPYGQEIVLRGIGLGGWLLPEGYMWKFPSEGDRPRRIENYFNKVLGKDKAKAFWFQYHRHFITLSDIQAIKAEGFNSIRIPLHWRFLLTSENQIDQENWTLLDQVIDWCEQEKLYVILDLHSAPGGQTGSNIDDSEQDLPELFTKKANQDLTVLLWEKLAHHYKSKEIIACYDLLNEPLPQWFGKHNPKLIAFYKRLISAIRAIDPDHMISLEGVHWATDWTIFDRPWDNNILYQFHKYWNNPDQASIQRFLDFQEKWDVPILMGEGGENNKEWYTGTFPMLDDFKISWNFWTYKKMETTNSPYSIQMPKDWAVLSKAISEGTIFDENKTETILWEYLNNVKLENCTYIPQVANALFRRPPLTIPAVFYDWNTQTRFTPSRFNCGYRLEDGTEIRFLDSTKSTPDFSHGQGQSWAKEDWLTLIGHEGDTYSYRVFTKHKQEYQIILELAAECPATLEVIVGHQRRNIQLMDQNKKTLTIGSITFEQGDNEICLRVIKGLVKLISIMTK